MAAQPGVVLITGGCGFIGSNFVNYVFDKWPSTTFINIDKLEHGSAEENIEEVVSLSSRYKFINETIRDLDMLTRTLENYQVDTIIHFAAITHVDESYSDRIGTIAENVLSTTTLLESVSTHYHNLKRFVHISTDEVYGDSRDDLTPKHEQSLMNPTNPYAASKGACELILNAYHHSYKLPYVMVRMNNVYGPRQAVSKLIPKFTTLAIEGKPYPLMGDGQHTRSWMYVDDCAEAIRRTTESGRIGHTYNIGTDFEKSNYDLTLQIHQTVAELLQRSKTEPSFCRISDRPYHDRRYYIDFSKINQEMQWKCTTDFDEGITNTIRYYVNQYLETEKEKHGNEPARLKG